MLRRMAVLLAVLPVVHFAAERSRIPLVHTTDLYQPPMDPDDHVDLATLFALDEFDVQAVLLDVERPLAEGPLKPGQPLREPGFVPVAQLSYLTGKGVICAIGPGMPLRSPVDKALDQPRREQTAVEALLRELRRSPEPVVVTVLGSARIVTAAFNREPDLLRLKVKSVVINAGSSDDGITEYNVKLDVHAYVGLFRSGLPIDWYPCAHKGRDKVDAFNEHDRNTFWRISHRDLFRGLPQPLLAWFVYGFAGSSRGDLLRTLREEGRSAAAGMIQAGMRNMWSTASLALAAGRELVKTPEGWRFVPAAAAPPGAARQLMALEPATVEISDDGRASWKAGPAASKTRLFRRTPGEAHTTAMAEALNALLAAMPVE